VCEFELCSETYLGAAREAAARVVEAMEED